MAIGAGFDMPTQLGCATGHDGARSGEVMAGQAVNGRIIGEMALEDGLYGTLH